MTLGVNNVITLSVNNVMTSSVQKVVTHNTNYADNQYQQPLFRTQTTIPQESVIVPAKS